MPVISLLTKNVTKLSHPPGIDCSPFPCTFIGIPGDGEKSHPTAKHLLIFPIRKIPLNRFKSFAVKSFISCPSNSNFKVIILCNLYLWLKSFLLYHILNFRLYVHTCHTNFTNQYLLNVAFSMTKALNGWSSPKQNFHSLHLSIPSLRPSLQCYFENPASIITCFLLFHTPFFISYFIKFQLIPLQLGICNFAG